MTTSAEALSSRPAAEAYIERVCFKLGPPALVGAEIEWFTATADGARPTLAALARALGPHRPSSLDPHSPALPLPFGSAVTVEPGGQIELSSAPAGTPSAVCRSLSADRDVLAGLLARHGMSMRAGGADAARPPQRLLDLPRYRAMEARFARVGPYGIAMMCNTAATQVSVDAGVDAHDVQRRWHVLHAVGPALVAAFASTPHLHGCDDGWVSQRMRAWLALDPARTMVPVEPGDVRGVYARWALSVPILCVRHGAILRPTDSDASFADWVDGHLDEALGRRPTTADLDYHLSTLFPMVRPSGHLEVRYLDGGTGDDWKVPVHVIAALVSDSATLDAALGAAAGTEGRWTDAARDGLANPDLQRAAKDVLDVAAGAVADPIVRETVGARARRCARTHSIPEREGISR